MDAIYQLGNQRRDVYDALGVTFRQTFHKQYEWLASYTRSRALSNAVLDVSVDDPVLFSHNVGRMPWDAPNRARELGLPADTVRELGRRLPYRGCATDIPFSIQNSYGAVSG